MNVLPVMPEGVISLLGNFVNNDIYFFDKDAGITFDIFDDILLELVNVSSQLGAVGDIDCNHQPVFHFIVPDYNLFYLNILVIFIHTVDNHLT